MPLSYNLSLRQKLVLFWSQLNDTWQALASMAIPLAGSTVFISIIWLLKTFDIEVSSEIRSGIFTGFTAYLTIIFTGNSDVKKPTEPLKLRLFALPKKIYSLEMWIAEAPYTAVFILILVLCLAKYGQDFQQSGLPSGIDIFLALFFLSGAYVLCVLAQGYRDFAKQEWGPRGNGRHVHRRTTAPRRYQS